MAVRDARIADSRPFLRQRPPVLVDWLPENHVFGGSLDFNMILATCGSRYIGEGKPLKGSRHRSLDNLIMKKGTVIFNVPSAT